MNTPEEFMEYFRRNYPGPDTRIQDPDWHAEKIYAAAMAASGRFNADRAGYLESEATVGRIRVNICGRCGSVDAERP